MLYLKFSWQIKHVDAKQILVILIMHVIVQCKVIVYAAKIVNVVLMSVKKQYHSYNHTFSFLFETFN